MDKYRIIPKRTFQIIAVSLLLASIGQAVVWIGNERALYFFLLTTFGVGKEGLASVLTFLGLFLLWVVIIMPIRIFSQMPTFNEELQQAGVSSFKELFDQKLAANEPAVITNNVQPKRSARQQRTLAIGGLILASICSLIAVTIYLLLDALHIASITIAIFSFFSSVWHFFKSIQQA